MLFIAITLGSDSGANLIKKFQSIATTLIGQNMSSDVATSNQFTLFHSRPITLY